ncbi:uncharacterized protein PFL1_01132 [Pseudozyma flocculosa PF-1]|uniref:Zn(2)-C6 fungal-type domain-containing protein n=1 Tax=Pseudozyma flocculosa TaxID=84751 RepID=A0A5C3FC07_9BASI|nr:uncharacterized protein PFL1_01132 [Pseudozyma flocculosa PF-1]EPQ31800.1 hypothetical protein PFL1_01132 [Pseudozyma flocculosa PF-1]SPO41810.1 uncharacterized protein PSFLO_07292 [Pseudozyma flocculosa]
MDAQPKSSDAGDGTAAKKRRIWAACELCRKRKSRCDGQNPCKSCLNTVKATLPSSSLPDASSIGKGDVPTTSSDYAAWIAKAKEICIFDWNRKPRGPKARKRPGSSQSTDAAGLGAPRTEASAGAAYVQSQQLQLHRAMSDSDSSLSRAGLSPHDGSASFSPLTPTVSDSATSISSHGPAHMLARGSADAERLMAGSSMLHRLSGSPVGHIGSAGGGAELDRTQPFDPAKQRTQSPAVGYPLGFTSSPAGQSAAGGAPTFVQDSNVPWQAGGQGQPMNMAQQQPAVAPYPCPGEGFDGAGSSFFRHRRNSNASFRSSAQFSGASSGARSRTALSPERSNDSTAPRRPALGPDGSPVSDAAITHFAQATALSPPSDAIGPCDRYMDQTNLIDRLRPYCTDQDRPLVAIAIAHFAEFDSHEKLAPARYLFGQQSGGPQPEPPAYLLLALLALLSHRALLLPDDLNIEDLDLRAGPATLRCAAQNGRLEGEDRQEMLQFARRCWSLACDVMLQKIRAGEVDPRLVQCGLFLDLGAVEDGISTKKMAKMKYWLFRVLFCWRLHQIDLTPESPDYDVPWEPVTVLRRAIEYAGDVGDTDDDLPLPRIVDARGFVTDPIEREALRRTVIFMTCSAYWIQTSDMQLPRFDLFSMAVESVHRDDYIHELSNWTPKPRTRTNEYMQQTRYLVFRLYARVVRLLHTPLLDICTGRSPEPDLQRALNEMETESDWLRSRIGEVTFEGPEQPIKMAALVQSRLCEVMLYRLHLAIQAFYFLFPAETDARPDPSLKLATTMVPKEREHLSGFERIAGEAAGSAQQSSGVRHSSSPASADLVNGDRSQPQARMPPQPQPQPQPAAPPSDGGSPGLALLPKPTCTRSPVRACFASILEMGMVARRSLEMHRAREAALAPLEDRTVAAALSCAPGAGDKVGTGAGRTMDGILRSVRWPRHWRTIAQHAFAMAAETHVAGSSWGSTFAQNNPDWVEPPSFGFLPASEDKETLEAAMWSAGHTIVELLEAMGTTGSQHAANTAKLTRQYGQERYEWAMRHSQGGGGGGGGNASGSQR